MKDILLIVVATDDVLMCQPGHDVTSLGTTDVNYVRLPTNTSAAYRVTIRGELEGQKSELKVTRNSSVKSVQAAASIKLGQAVRIKKLKPVVWTPNKTYQFEKKSKLAGPIITAAVRDRVARQDGTDEVIKCNADNHNHIDACHNTVRSRGYGQERFKTFASAEYGCRINDTNGREISETRLNIDIFLAIAVTTGRSSDTNVSVIFSRVGPDHFMTRFGYQTNIGRHLPKDTLSE